MPAPVTACVIARNEAKQLPACIASLRNAVAEVVVLDTGSTDATATVAASLGARVHHFAWIDDFSAARNTVVAYAAHPYILMVDADEQLAPEAADALLAYCASSHAAGRVYRDNLVADAFVREYLTRLYPNAPGWQWTGRVHEQLTLHGAPPPSIATAVRLLHTGYVPEELASGEKVQRNLRLLELEHQSRPEDPYILYQIGRTHFVAENWQAAVTALVAAVDRGVAHGVPYLPSLLRTLAYSALNVGDLTLAFDVLRAATDLFPDYTDLYFAYATALLASGDGSRLHEVRSLFEGCLALGDPDPARYETVAGVGSYRAHHNLGAFYEATGQLDLARNSYRAAAASHAPSRARLTALT
jgi:glycosyltransferase involved in cell wall biosynthesis